MFLIYRLVNPIYIYSIVMANVSQNDSKLSEMCDRVRMRPQYIQAIVLRW